MIRTTLVLWIAMACAGIGNVFFSKGMKKMGSLKSYALGSLVSYFLSCLINVHVIFGILISTVYFLLWLVVLSWADVSWALPMNAIEYIFVTLLAMFFLGEKISLNRWIGVGLITTGVFFMMRSW